MLLPAIGGQFAAALLACARGGLQHGPALTLSAEKVVGVVLASGGYPGQMTLGKVITGIEAANALDGVVVFHAGTKAVGDQVVTSGGRVLTVTGDTSSLVPVRFNDVVSSVRITPIKVTPPPAPAPSPAPSPSPTWAELTTPKDQTPFCAPGGR